MSPPEIPISAPEIPISAPAIDPITLEVVRETLSSIVREMRVTLVRTA